MKPKARLENWCIGKHPFDSDTDRCLFGEVYGHPELPDGRGVTTSPIVSVDLINKVAETNNTMYELGDYSTKIQERFEKNHEVLLTYLKQQREDCKSPQEPDS